MLLHRNYAEQRLILPQHFNLGQGLAEDEKTEADDVQQSVVRRGTHVPTVQ